MANRLSLGDLGDLPVSAKIEYASSTKTIKFNPDQFSNDKTQIIRIGGIGRKKRNFAVHYEEKVGKFVFVELKTHEDRLKELNNLFEKGLITKVVFDEKMQEILKEI